MKATYRKKQKEVHINEPLNMKHYLSIVNGMSAKRNMLAEAMINKVK